jgi:AcrR family transcriptional regulator
MAVSSSQDEAERPDGRRVRGEENRRRIVEAFMELVRRGHVTPTAEEVAARAKVGLRTVFRHFEDMELLYREIGNAIEAPIMPIVQQPFRANDWRGRLKEMVARRAEVYERLTPFMITSAANEHRSPHLRRRALAFARNQRSLLLSIVPEVEALTPAQLDALDLMLSFEAWLGLRRARRLDAGAAKAAVQAGVDALTTEIV